MSYREPARTTTRRFQSRGRIRVRRLRVAGLLVFVAAITVALGNQSPAASFSTGASAIDALRSELPRALGDARSEHRGGLGEADGGVPGGTTVFEDAVAGVAKLNPNLLSALRDAATDAADDGVAFVVDSGWRSARYQEQLFREAISKYGSQAQAATNCAPKRSLTAALPCTPTPRRIQGCSRDQQASADNPGQRNPTPMEHP